ncbi:Maf family protein [Enterococcus sp. LJL128]|uniref:Maf family protein n=1 Tax=Enterococcus sp. LJL51 TaxID=3416656 RepID=UPI003CEAFB73
MKVILASQSPRRQQLLKRLLPNFEVEAAAINEAVPPNMLPENYVQKMAMDKAQCIFKKHPEAKVIGCDTIVAVENEIIGKPTSREHAFEILKKLSGQTHQVYTAVVVMEEGKTVSMLVPADVTFYQLTDEEINQYLDSGEYMDKAGAYGIQEQGALFVKEIKGDYYTIMGLPIASLSRLLAGDYEQL